MPCIEPPKWRKKIAAEKNFKMPLWKDGKIIYIDSKIIHKI